MSLSRGTCVCFSAPHNGDRPNRARWCVEPGHRQSPRRSLAVGAAQLDDFDRDPMNTWPRAWLKDANASNRAQRNVADPTDPTNKVLRLSGMIGGSWAALAYRPGRLPVLLCTVQARVYNGSERLSVGAFRGQGHDRPPTGNVLAKAGLGPSAFRGKGGIAAADDTVSSPISPDDGTR